MSLKDNSNMEELVSGDFRAIPSQNRIIVMGTEQVVQRKVMQLLVILCSEQGKTLSKQQLTEAIWPDVIVSQESLANIVARLRRVLGDNAKAPAYIETVQGIGYRWIAPVEFAQPRVSNSKKKRYLLALGLTGLLCLLVIGYDYYTEQDRPSISDLKIIPIENGVEVAIGVQGEPDNLDQQAVLQQVEELTGLKVDGDNVKVVIDNPPDN